jgi:hypothetical protein
MVGKYFGKEAKDRIERLIGNSIKKKMEHRE